MKERKKNKGSGAAAAAVLIVALLVNLAGTAGFAVIVLLLAGGVICAAAFVMGKKFRVQELIPVKKKQESCDYGKLHHEFSHDSQRRLTQLEGFYRDGLIDRREYELLLRRWSD